METAVSFLKQIANDRQTIDSFTNQLTIEVQEGSIETQWLHGALTKLIKNLTELKDLNAQSLDADNIYKEAFGFTYMKKEAGAKYDFSNCNHPKWIELSQKENEIKEQKKDIETTLKTIKAPMTIVDNETGDIISVNPPIKSSKTIIEVR
jgi:hypothetical protein